MWEQKTGTALSSSPSQDTRFSRLGKSIQVRGTITGQENLYIDGEVEGDVILDGQQVIVGPNGHVKADLQARMVTIQGYVKGNITAEESAELGATGTLEGSLAASRVRVDEGAELRGQLNVGRAAQAGERKMPSRETAVKVAAAQGA